MVSPLLDLLEAPTLQDCFPVDLAARYTKCQAIELSLWLTLRKCATCTWTAALMMKSLSATVSMTLWRGFPTFAIVRSQRMYWAECVLWKEGSCCQVTACSSHHAPLWLKRACWTPICHWEHWIRALPPGLILCTVSTAQSIQRSLLSNSSWIDRFLCPLFIDCRSNTIHTSFVYCCIIDLT